MGGIRKDPAISELALIRNAASAARDLAASFLVSERPSVSFPGYDVIREVFRGGQGIVYRAIQDATGREVAIKVPRDGSVQPLSDQSRFEREVRVLGRLQHPNIVTIHDSGVVGGRHYFVMDYISGLPLDAYVAAIGASAKEIVVLIRKVCLAVHAAHVRGVIHRDLKPGNIRVNTAGEPFILDFGLAKMSSLVGDGRDPTMTETGQFLGSFPWASPEQLAGSSEDIDLRADVYALGVILFQLLTGQFPFPKCRNLFQEMNHILRGDPIRPRSIRADLAEDLELIVLKCLARSPENRYQSAASLAEDLQRYLDREPIHARAPSAVYQARRLIARHPWPFASIVTLFLVISGFSIWMGVLYARAAGERNRALQAEAQAEQRKSDAEREARTAKAVGDFLVNDLLAAAAPANARGRKITVEEAMNTASSRVRTAFADDPLVRASILSTVGFVYSSMGLFDDASGPLEEADSIRSARLGNDHPDTLSVRTQRVDVFIQTGAYAQAESLAESTYEGLRRALGDDHVETLRAAGRVAQAKWLQGEIEEPRRLNQYVYERLRVVLGEDHPDALHSLGQWAQNEYLDEGDIEDSEAVFRRALDAARQKLGDDHPDTLRMMTNLAMSLVRQRRFSEAEGYLVTSLSESRRILGDRHPDSLATAVHLAIMREQQGRIDEAEALCRHSAEVARETLGIASPQTLWTLDRLGNITANQGDAGGALQIMLEVFDHQQRLWGSNEQGIRFSRDGVGDMLFRLGRLQEAAEAHREALRNCRARKVEGRGTIGSLRPLMLDYQALGDEQAARPIAEDLLEIRREVAEAAQRDAYTLNAYARELLEAYPVDLRDAPKALEYALRAYEVSSDEYDYNRFTLARAYEANGQLPEAIEMIRRALADAPVEFSESRAKYEAFLVQVLEASGDLVAAETACRETLEKRRAVFESPHPDIAESLERLGELLLRHGKEVEAEPVLRECLEVRLALDGEHWTSGLAMTLLGRSLAAQGQSDDAERLLVEGVDLVADHPFAPRSALAAAAAAAADFFDSQGQRDRARHYESIADQPR